MEFPGVLKGKARGNSRGQIKKSGISRGVQENIMWNFQGSEFLL